MKVCCSFGFVARHPVWTLCLSAAFCIILGAISISTKGLSYEESFFIPRGTKISDRCLTARKLLAIRSDIFYGVIDFDSDTSSYDDDDRRRLTKSNNAIGRSLLTADGNCPAWNDPANNLTSADLYLNPRNIHSAWKVKPGTSALDDDQLTEICEDEKKTFETMIEKNFCLKCSEDGLCMQPFSLIAAISEHLSQVDGSAFSDNFDLECDKFTEKFQPQKDNFTDVFAGCADNLRETWIPWNGEYFQNCPLRSFVPSLINSDFGINNTAITYTSTIYPTDTSKIDDGDNGLTLDDIDDFDKGKKGIVEARYDTKDRTYADLYSEERLMSVDIPVFMLGIVVAFFCVLFNYRSLFLAIMMAVQIILAVPLAIFFYSVVFNLGFQSLNLIGFFLIVALGADDVFVSSDKWRDRRLNHPKDTTEEIAAHVLPASVGAILLTTITTAFGFFSSATSTVTLIRNFVVFTGLLIVCKYFTVIFIFFPSLVLWDSWVQGAEKPNCCVLFGKKKNEESEVSEGDVLVDNENGSHTNDASKETASDKFLSKYYTLLHKARWVVLAVFVTGCVVFPIFASKFPPTDEIIPNPLPESNEYSQFREWKGNVLESDSDYRQYYQVAYFIWGLRPYDNGKTGELPPIVLDTDFDPSSEKAQTYLKNFCDNAVNEPFIDKPFSTYQCPINMLDTWLKEQNAIDASERSMEYSENCDSASGIPMSPSSFHGCMIAYSRLVNNRDILPYEKNGEERVQVLINRVQTIVPKEQPYEDLETQYENFEDFTGKAIGNAPSGVDKFFYHNEGFVTYKAVESIGNTAVGSIVGSLLFVMIVVLISSSSLELTLFSVLTIGFIMATVIAVLYWIGWQLGTYEAICLAIVIGVSCDFIIHIGHAYSHHKGKLSREKRTKEAILNMGPSVIFSFITTFISSCILLVCTHRLIYSFGVVFIATMLTSIFTTFVFFTNLTDIFGSAEPKKFINEKVWRQKKKSEVAQDEDIDVVQAADTNTGNA